MVAEVRPLLSIQLPMPFTSLQPSTTTHIVICNISPMKVVHGSMRPSPTPRKTKGMILSWRWTAMAICMSLTTVMMAAAICDYRVESTASGKTRPLPVPSTSKLSRHRHRLTRYDSHCITVSQHQAHLLAFRYARQLDGTDRTFRRKRPLANGRC